MRLTDLLCDVPGDEKRAGVELEDTAKLEQDFSRMAYGFLRDRATPLLKYLVGFEIVDKADDGSSAAGIFGVSVGGALYYIPVFFVSGQIKGMDLLYSVKSRQFLPLQEAQINHILRKASVNIGQAARKDAGKDVSSPDFRFLRSPPSGASPASGGTGQGGYKTACDMRQEVSRSLIEDVEFQRMMAAALMKAAGDSLSDVWDRDSSLIAGYVSNHCGQRGALALGRSLCGTRFVKAAAAFYDPRDLLVHVDAPPAPEPKLVRVSDASMCKASSAAGRQRFLRHGFDYIDKRAKDEKSESLQVDGIRALSNPDRSGVYTVLLAGGRSDKLVVARPSVGPGEFRALMVIDPGNGKFFTAAATQVFVLPSHSQDEDSVEGKLWGKADSVASTTPESDCALVSDNGRMSMPFEVLERVGGSDGVTKLSVRWKPYITFKDPDRDDSSGYENTRAEIIVRPGRGDVRRVGSSYLVPSENWRALKLSGNCCDICCCSRSPDDAKDDMQPASSAEVMESLYRDGHVAEVIVDSNDGHEFALSVNDERKASGAGYKTAMAFLVERMGMDVDDAEDMLKESAAKYKSARLLKLAASYMPQPGSQQRGYDEETGVPVEEPQVEQYQGGSGAPPPPPERRPGDQSARGGEAQTQSQAGGLPGDVENLAGQAAQTGQKSVFDHAVIGGLARTYDVNYAIDSFLPEMMKTLDRLGRILFLFYWKNEEFSERYGSTDMSDLEDQLRSVFKNYGDLLLKLQSKSVSADAVDAYSEG